MIIVWHCSSRSSGVDLPLPRSCPRKDTGRRDSRRADVGKARRRRRSGTAHRAARARRQQEEIILQSGLCVSAITPAVLRKLIDALADGLALTDDEGLLAPSGLT